MSKHQYEIGKINCTQLSHQAADWMVCFFKSAGASILFTGGDYGCCL
ncbi:hypothetical protein [Bartonella sp. B39]